ncbi:MAG: potassium transporter TrkG [Candidatus Auribacterota bacterium]|nr:potassium transporter TrkG [Candidatus Auribacterota bacterium]
MSFFINFRKQLVLSLSQRDPKKVLMAGYLGLIALGTLCLSFSFAQKTNVLFIDNLFIAASAVSTTGLVTLNISQSYTFFGQLVIALLIQLGAVGYMAIASGIVLVITKKITKTEANLLKTDFSLPQHFNLYDFLFSVITFTFVIELVGSVALYFTFLNKGIEHSLWQAIFHSISMFGTAGFSLFKNNLQGFYNDPWLNITATVLCYLGGMGFIVITDVWERFKKNKIKITYTSRIILQFTSYMMIIGTSVIFFTEKSIQQYPLIEKLWVALFQAMTALNTAGFSTLDMSTFSHSVLFFMTILMIIGASPSGTGGGLKSTTVITVIAQMIRTFKGKKEVLWGKNQIPEHRVRLALARFSFYFVLLGLGIYCLTLTEDVHIFDVIFETVSALSTVGLSTGLTPNLTVVGKIVVISLMFIGRIGPLSLGAALFFSREKVNSHSEKHDLAI